MENYSYLTFNNIDCILIEKDDSISLIPKNKEDLHLLYKYYYDQQKDFPIYYSTETYPYKYAYISRVISNFNSSITLYPKFVIHSICEKICTMEITGEAVDDFFSPSTYFFYKSCSGIKDFGNIVYKDNVADNWKIQFNEVELNITLLYGSILRHGIASDLMLHPKLKIEFSEISNYDLLFKLYLAVKRFFQFVLYKKNCGCFDVELFSNIEGHFSSVGRMFDINSINNKYTKQSGRIVYSDYKHFMPMLLKFAFQNNSLYLKHLPEDEYRDRHDDDIELVYTRLFTAFESECHAKKELYDIADDSNICDVRNDLLDVIGSFADSYMNQNNDVKQFINDATQRIQQLGTQFGQTRKIMIAYSIISKGINKLIPDILFLHEEYCSCTSLTEQQIKKIARELTKLRGSLVHGSYKNQITEKQYQLIKFLETIIYAQMLKRANIAYDDIELIVGSTLLSNHSLFSRKMEEIENHQNNKNCIDNQI